MANTLHTKKNKKKQKRALKTTLLRTEMQNRSNKKWLNRRVMETNICIYFVTISNISIGRVVCSVFDVNMTFEKSIFSKKTKIQQIHIELHARTNRKQTKHQANKSINCCLTLHSIQPLSPKAKSPDEFH